jgi:ADP-L-glycero-D-manno-heptose 6-epimerase
MIVVTGGAGFIGSCVVANLDRRRPGSVVLCDRFTHDERWRNVATADLADILTPEELLPYLDQNRNAIEAVIHLGAISATTETDVQRIIQENIRFTLDLWRCCTSHGMRFLYASSAATYGDGSEGFRDEDSTSYLARLRPLNAYGWSKHLVDRTIARWVEGGKPTPPQWAGLKFFNVYGPNEYHKGSMQSVVCKSYPRVAGGDAVTLFQSHRAGYADGDQTRDFVYVKDAVAVIDWLLEHPEVSGLFNVGTGQARSFGDLVRAVFSAVGKPPNIQFVPMPEEIRQNYQYFTQADMTKLRAAGYTAPFWSLEAGVDDYVQKYLAQSTPYAGVDSLWPLAPTISSVQRAA